MHIYKSNLVYKLLSLGFVQKSTMTKTGTIDLGRMTYEPTVEAIGENFNIIHLRYS